VSAPLLDVAGLRVGFPRAGTEAVRGIALEVRAGEAHGLVGESGSGKSLTALAVMGLLPKGARRSAGRLAIDGADLLTMNERALSRLRGNRMAMVFQEPMTSLNPAYTIGSQLAETWTRHRPGGRRAGLLRAGELLARVGVPNPGLRLAQFPHQLSGGLRQRAMIAMALMCDPALLIADEPTTALDVTVQAGILRLLAGLRADLGLGLLLITHDLGVVARTADRVSVMYAGEVVETGPVASLFTRPGHPYTRGLLGSVPVPGRARLVGIPGTVPQLPMGFTGCAFRDRCAHARPDCALPPPVQQAGSGHSYLCVMAPA
jgi:peptide/nickel transport system ATP-binding protein